MSNRPHPDSNPSSTPVPPRTATKSAATSSDVLRQVVVLLGSAVAIVGAFIGSGATGGESQPEIGDGARAADATLVAPGQPAFSIWSVIYTGLVAYAIWQALPAQRADPRQRRVGWLVLVSMVLNAVWIGVVQAGLLTLSVPVIVALLATLVVVVLRLQRTPADGTVETVVLDGTMGLYLGWVSVATIANVAAVLTSAGLTRPLGLAPEVWSVAVLAVAAAVGLLLARYAGARWTIAVALAWGLAWIAIARWSGEPQSTPTAVAAATAAVVVLLGPLLLRGSAAGRTPRAG